MKKHTLPSQKIGLVVCFIKPVVKSLLVFILLLIIILFIFHEGFELFSDTF